jgi:hypothetical protein
MPADRREQGTGGRGSTGALPDVSVDEFGVVDEAAELSRSRTEPSKVQPLIDLARSQLGRRFERTDVVMENGAPKLNEDGQPVRVPHQYTLEAAEEFAGQLRNAAQRNKLPQKRLSLRIVSEPSLTQVKDGKAKPPIRVQFYIVGRKPTEASA